MQISKSDTTKDKTFGGAYSHAFQKTIRIRIGKYLSDRGTKAVHLHSVQLEYMSPDGVGSVLRHFHGVRVLLRQAENELEPPAM
jgi:hypothetical protein